SIAVGILIAFVVTPHTHVQAPSAYLVENDNTNLTPTDNHSNITFLEKNQIQLSQPRETLPTFSSPDEVRGFLKNHTVSYDYMLFPQNSRRTFFGSTGTISLTDC